LLTQIAVVSYISLSSDMSSGGISSSRKLALEVETLQPTQILL